VGDHPPITPLKAATRQDVGGGATWRVCTAAPIEWCVYPSGKGSWTGDGCKIEGMSRAEYVVVDFTSIE
jgi:hypothetical protein